MTIGWHGIVLSFTDPLTTHGSLLFTQTAKKNSLSGSMDGGIHTDPQQISYIHSTQRIQPLPTQSQRIAL